MLTIKSLNQNLKEGYYSTVFRFFTPPKEREREFPEFSVRGKDTEAGRKLVRHVMRQALQTTAARVL